MRLFLGSASAAALAICVAAGTAAAGNWTLGGRISERVEARSGLGFDEDDELFFRSTTTLGLGLGYETPRTVWAVNSAASYRQSVGEEGDDGDDDGDGLQGVTDPRVSGSVVHRSADHVLGANLSFRRRSLDIGDSVLFEDDFGEVEFIDVEEGATETALNFGANWNWSATPRTSFGLGTDVSIRRFSDDSSNLEPSDSIRFTGSVNRALDARTSGGLSLSYRNLRSDGEVTETRTDALILSANASRDLTPRHTLGVSIGTGATLREEETALSIASEDDLDFNFQGGLTFSYATGYGTRLSLSAQRALQPTSEGTLENTTTVAVGMNQPLTQRISLGLNGAYGRRSSDSDDLGRENGGTDQSLRLSTGLNAELAPRWTASAGIDLRYAQGEDEDDDFSTGVFFQISRALVLNP